MRKPKPVHDGEETSEATIRRLSAEKENCEAQLQRVNQEYLQTNKRLHEVEVQLIWYRQMCERLAVTVENISNRM